MEEIRPEGWLGKAEGKVAEGGWSWEPKQVLEQTHGAIHFLLWPSRRGEDLRHLPSHRGGYPCCLPLDTSFPPPQHMFRAFWLRQWYTPIPIHSDLESDERGKKHCQTGNPAPGLYHTPAWYNPNAAWYLPRSGEHNRFRVGLLGLMTGPVLSCLTARLSFTSSDPAFSCEHLAFLLALLLTAVNCPDKWKSSWNYVAL